MILPKIEINKDGNWHFITIVYKDHAISWWQKEQQEHDWVLDMDGIDMEKYTGEIEK